MIILGRHGRPRPAGDWRDIAWIVMPFAVAVLVLDAVTLLRVAAFESQPPAAVEASGRVWNQPAGHRRKAQLRIESSEGWVDLATGPATVFGSAQAPVGSTQLDLHAPATVAWLDAPGSLFHGTFHYPIRIEQKGRVLFKVDGAAGVAVTQRGDLLAETLIVAIGGVLLPAMSLMFAHRLDVRRSGAKSEQFRQRRQRR